MSNLEIYHSNAVIDVIREMENQGFFKLTFMEKGFQECHNYALKFDLNIQNHDSEACYFCNKDTNSNEDHSGGFMRLKIFENLYYWVGTKIKGLIPS